MSPRLSTYGVAMQIRLANGKMMTLSKQEFLTQGGEGRIYVRDAFAYKIYADRTKALSTQKLYELQRIKSPNIVTPTQPIYDIKGNIRGYQMPFVQNSKPLCRIFNLAYKKQHNITSSVLLKLITQLKKIVYAVHQQNCLIVDLGAHNFLLSSDHTQLYCVDVDSFQTPSFPATALLDSVKDWHRQDDNFSQNSDWFSFAILCVQIMMGIHPYRGKHPHIKSLSTRMQQSVSIFDPSVRLPLICPPIEILPLSLRTWLESVLQKKQRLAPPKTTETTITSTSNFTPSTKLLAKKMQLTSSHPILGYLFDRSQHYLLTKQHLIGSQQRIPLSCPAPCSLICEPKSGRIIVVCLHNKQLFLYDPKRNALIGDALPVRAISCFHNQVFALQHNRLLQINLHLVNNNIIYTTSIQATVLPKASKLFTGCIIQDMFGTKICTPLSPNMPRLPISLPLPKESRIVDATCVQHVAQILYRYKGELYLRRIFLTPDLPHHTYPNIETENTHFVITDAGVGIWLQCSGDLEIFSTVDIHSPRRNLLSVLCGDELLQYSNGKVLYINSKELIHIEMQT